MNYPYFRKLLRIAADAEDKKEFVAQYSIFADPSEAQLDAIWEYAHNRTPLQIRQMAGLSQNRFYENYGVPRRTTQEWENGRMSAPPYVTDLLAFAVISSLHWEILCDQ